MRQAPWTDFAGNPIYEGDTIRHPNGDVGTVIFLDEDTIPVEDRIHDNEMDLWFVDYDGDLLPLFLQIGEKGRAVVELRSTQ